MITIYSYFSKYRLLILRCHIVDAVIPQLEHFDDLPDEGDLDVIYTKDGKLPKFAYIGNVANEVRDESCYFSKIVLIFIS